MRPELTPTLQYHKKSPPLDGSVVIVSSSTLFIIGELLYLPPLKALKALKARKISNAVNKM
ncbi:hypothetical protein HMPREF9539_02427 [Escherichia coli MS 110-3]|nr:hypothetical protein HMPREF9539_02427 [Escherichia coli MS 110-3]